VSARASEGDNDDDVNVPERDVESEDTKEDEEPETETESAGDAEIFPATRIKADADAVLIIRRLPTGAISFSLLEPAN